MALVEGLYGNDGQGQTVQQPHDKHEAQVFFTLLPKPVIQLLGLYVIPEL